MGKQTLFANTQNTILLYAGSRPDLGHVQKRLWSFVCDNVTLASRIKPVQTNSFENFKLVIHRIRLGPSSKFIFL